MRQPATPSALAWLGSLAQPENNLTGLSIDTWILNEKRLEVLKDSFPRVKRVSVLANFGNPSGRAQWELARSGGEALGLSMVLTSVDLGDDLDGAFRGSRAPAPMPCM